MYITIHSIDKWCRDPNLTIQCRNSTVPYVLSAAFLEFPPFRIDINILHIHSSSIGSPWQRVEESINDVQTTPHPYPLGAVRIHIYTIFEMNSLDEFECTYTLLCEVKC